MHTHYAKWMVLLSAVAAMAGCATGAPRLPPWKPIAPPVPQSHPTAGAIYDSSNARAWFTDTRAHHVGDILTIVLQESTQASKKASTSTSKKDSTDLGAATLFGHSLPSGGGDIAGLSSQRSFDGSGSSSQSDQLTGALTVTVTRQLPNGNLVVQGQKWLVINQGHELLRLVGVVRPEDITPDNTVLSTRVADARIAYTGTGAVARSNFRGWLSRFFNSKWMPF